MLIGMTEHLLLAPLYQAARQAEDDFEGALVIDGIEEIVTRLLRNELDAAFIAPIEYALGMGQFFIVPEQMMTMTKISHLCGMFCNRDLTTITSVALSNLPYQWEVCARILCREKYEIQPDFIVTDESVEQALRAHDAVFAAGEPCAEAVREHPVYLDCVEEWYDFTGLPYVYWMAVAPRDVWTTEAAEQCAHFHKRLIDYYHQLDSIANPWQPSAPTEEGGS